MTEREREGAWIRLSWDRPIRAAKVVLYDRISCKNQVTAGVLGFSDGSTITVGTLDNKGSPNIFEFEPKVVTEIFFNITQVSYSTEETGLAEIMVYELEDEPECPMMETEKEEEEKDRVIVNNEAKKKKDLGDNNEEDEDNEDEEDEKDDENVNEKENVDNTDKKNNEKEKEEEEEPNQIDQFKKERAQEEEAEVEKNEEKRNNAYLDERRKAFEDEVKRMIETEKRKVDIENRRRNHHEGADANEIDYPKTNFLAVSFIIISLVVVFVVLLKRKPGSRRNARPVTRSVFYRPHTHEF